jgi:hypothetical protein
MRHFTLKQIIATAGGYNLSEVKVEAYMTAEAKKLRPNAWYYVAKCLPFKSQYLYVKMNDAIFFLFVAGWCMMVAGFTSAFAAMLIGFKIASVIGCGIGLMGSGLIWLMDSKFTGQAYTILMPGAWHTGVFTPETNLKHVHPKAIELVGKLSSVLPQATFEISTLYQGTEIFDPVLWLIPTGRLGKRIPILIWDKDGNIVDLS